MSVELKPCPFCGGDEVTIGSFGSSCVEPQHYVSCEECDGATVNHVSEGEAIAAWNRRAASEPVTDAARPAVVLAYSTKGHSKPCGQTMGANGCGEFVTIYYGDIDAAEKIAREKISAMQRDSYRFNWALVMRADEEAYRGPAMSVERIDRAGAKGGSDD